MKGNTMILTGALALASCMILSEATFILLPAIGGTAALGGLALLKLAALKGLVVGALLSGDGGGSSSAPAKGHYGRRHRRSADDIESLLLTASQRDASDCAKKLICEVNGLSLKEIDTPEEAMILRLFNAEALDVSKLTVEFDLAAQIGKRAGVQQCSLVYERCPHNKEKLIQFFNDPNTGNVA